MDSLTRDYPHALLAPQEPPCLSIYQPTHRSHREAAEDPIRFRNLVRELEESLSQHHSPALTARLLEPLRAIAGDRDFWQHNLDGLSVLSAAGTTKVYRLQRPVPELAVVAESFHTRPLLRIVQSADRFQVLGLDRFRISLFEGNRDALDAVELAGAVPKTMIDALGEETTEPHLTVATYGSMGPGEAMYHGHGDRKNEREIDAERYFLAVDRAVLEFHSRPSKLPLLLAALPQHQGMFRGLTKNPFLLPHGIDADHTALGRRELLARAWQVLEPHYLERLSGLRERFGAAAAHQTGSSDLSDVARAAAQGRVETLLVEAERLVPGRLDSETGRITEHDPEHPDGGDLLDDLGEQVLRTGGEVVVVPAERMPSESGLAAIYRY